MLDKKTGTTLIPTPFRNGEIIYYLRKPHKVIRFLHCSSKGHTYRARNTLKDEVVDVTLPVVKNIDRGNKKGEEYYQVLELNEEDKDNTFAVLKLWERNITRSFKLRWDEDVEAIRDGLMMEDKEVFCTVMKVMGKEVMGDIVYLPRDPPILKVPDLVMSLIFSNLSFEDRLSSRLVLRRWTEDILPIHKVLNFKILVFEDKHHPHISASLRPLCLEDKLTVHKVKIKDLQALADASLLHNVDYLSIIRMIPERSKEELDIILEHCRNVSSFSLVNKECKEKMSRFVNRFVYRNQEHLETIRLYTTFSTHDLDLQCLIADSKPKILDINLFQKSSIDNLEWLPNSVSHLRLINLNVPLVKKELLWISTHLTNLVRLDLHVEHLHTSLLSPKVTDDDEMDEGTISDMLNSLKHLKYMLLLLGSLSWMGVKTCRKGKGIIGELNKKRNGWKCSLERYKSNNELFKIGKELDDMGSLNIDELF